MDFYGLLGITKSATDYEIKKAFKRMALQLIRSLKDDECVEEMFITVAEAYDVLSNDKLKAVYDQYGEAGLKSGVPSPDGFIEAYAYHGDFMRTYEDFFGTQSPYADLLDAFINPTPIYELPEGRGFKNKAEPLVRPIFLTLEELYQGCVKKIKIKRQELISVESGGQTELKEKILEVPIKPGMLQGTEICFPEEGDQGPTIIPADIIFKLTDLPHDLFTREGTDLYMTVHVTLLESLVGTTIQVKTPDYRKLRIPIHDIIHPTYQKIVPKEGMPHVDNPEEKGNLILKFQIDFPTYLPRTSKNLIRKALDVCKILSTPGEADNINLRVMVDKMMRIPYYERLPPAEPCQPIPLKPCLDDQSNHQKI